MTTNAKIKTQIQKLVPGQLVELYNLVSIDGGVSYNFCGGTMDDGSIVKFGGVNYTPLPVESEGWEIGGDGKLPRPIIRLSNVTGVLQAATISYNDFVGWTLTRRRTFYQYLDGGSSPDPSAQFPPDIYIINRKTKHTPTILEYELISAIDNDHIYLPRKQALSLCTHRYRCYVDGAFNNASINYAIEIDPEITCPYQGSTYYTIDGVLTSNPAEDNCGRRLRDCKLRFGTTNPLPYEGFPNARKFLRYK